MKSFVVSEFGYCPLVWMSHSKKLNSGVNKRYERVLRIYMFLKRMTTDLQEKNISYQKKTSEKCNKTIGKYLFKVKNKDIRARSIDMSLLGLYC